MVRRLVIPAAGRGSRLGADVPKVLVPVAGRPMIDWLLDLYRPFVDRATVIVSPDARSAVQEHLRSSALPVAFASQAHPTGMLDAILAAREPREGGPADRIWITWCDQIGLRPATLRRLADEESRTPEAALVLPTSRRADPYIHLARGEDGRIVRVLHRREGDAMPAEGESDAGLFALSAAAFAELLPQFAREAEPAAGTGERNFLPFIAWLAARRPVVTFPCETPDEAIGVNTPEELALVERHLRARTHA